MNCSVDDGTTHSRTMNKGRNGMCRRHYDIARGAIEVNHDTARVKELEQPVDDGVRSPQDLPIQPKASVMQPDGRTWAVLMPYPSLDGTQECARYPELFDITEDQGDQSRLLLDRMELCARCPFLAACREWSIAHEQYGFWAGMSATARRNRRRARGQLLATPTAAYAVGFIDRDWSIRLDLVAAGEKDYTTFGGEREVRDGTEEGTRATA